MLGRGGRGRRMGRLQPDAIMQGDYTSKSRQFPPVPYRKYYVEI